MASIEGDVKIGNFEFHYYEVWLLFLDPVGYILVLNVKNNFNSNSGNDCL